MITHQPDESNLKPLKPRGEERRVRSEIAPPPFAAAEGEVPVDRRTHVDRRAAWLREYTLRLDQQD